jgi:hypothetical protein
MNGIIVTRKGWLKLVDLKRADPREEAPHQFRFKTVWTFKDGTQVQLYGCDEGHANSENKYEFPPPVAEILFFGDCLLVLVRDGNVADFAVKTWKIMYKKLFKGFDTLASDEERSEDETEIASGNLTKEGYERDGFVVD